MQAAPTRLSALELPGNFRTFAALFQMAHRMTRSTTYTFKELLQPLLSVLRNLAMLLVIYTLCRLVYFFLNRASFPGVDGALLLRMMRGGLRFDIAALMFTNVVYMLLALLPFRIRSTKGWLAATKTAFVVPNFIAFAIDLMDAVYFPYSNRRTTCTVFKEFGGDSNLGGIFLHEALAHWYLVLLGALILFVLIRFYAAPYSRKVSAYGWKGYLSHTAIFAAVLYPIVGGMRGGFGGDVRPIALNDAKLYCTEPLQTAVVLNTAFSMFKTVEAKEFPRPEWFATEAEARAVFDPVHTPGPDAGFQPRNVVVIVLESFSAAYSSFLTEWQGDPHEGYMPFLDSLMQESLVFRHSFAHDKISISALPAVMTGIPMVIEPYFLTPYANDRLRGLATELVENEGYSSAFYHGAQRQSLGLAGFAESVGFREQFSRESYGNEADYDGTWGIWDEPFFRYFKEGLDSMEEPFIGSIFSLTSHHPYHVPPQYESILPDGRIPMHKCVAYTDHVLREFFDSCSREPWYRNTLFVITGDHTNRIDIPSYNGPVGGNLIPIIFYTPDGSLKGMRNGIAQQTDIQATVLSYLGYGHPHVSFGVDLLTTPDEETFAFYQRGDIYQFVQDEYLLCFDGEKSVGLYRFTEDMLLEHNLLEDGDPETAERASRMETRLKAYLQQLLTRIVDNRLTPES